MTMLFREQLKSVIEVLLFVSPDPVPLATLSRIAEIDNKDVLELLLELQKEYQNNNRGIQVVEIAGGWQLATKPQLAPYIERLFKRQSGNGISRAALEILAITAYRQPVTRSEIELIRGVKSESSITTLCEKKLIEEKGRRDAPGRPVLYGTTDLFLKHFGLKSLSEMPELDAFLVEAEQLENLD